MRHRSYWIHTDVADALTSTVDDLHYTHRRPKHEVLSAVVAAGLAHPDEVLARLNENTPGGEA
jgi:hypothetical protein